MNKSILYFSVISFSVSAVLPACTQKDILYEADFNVTLASENTYYAGDPVVFNFDGNVDNILFFSGESGHEYQYRDRYSITIDKIQSAKLEMQIRPRYGKGSMQIWYSSTFTGLNGSDGEADRATLAQMESGMSGWTSLYASAEDEPNLSNESVEPISVTKDITDALDNFSIAFLWNHDSEEIQTEAQRHYWVDGSISIVADGFGTITTDLSDLGMTSVMMNEELDPYYKNAGNGSIRFDTAHDITFQGINPVSSGGPSYPLKGWVVTTPQMLNAVANDTGTIVKNLQNYMTTYSYTWSEPGTYHVVFVGRNYNYVGSSELVKELTVTILPPKVGGGAGDSTVQE